MTIEICGSTTRAANSAESALSGVSWEQLDRLRIDAAECVAVGVVLIDSDDCILWCNQEFGRLLGYLSPELVGEGIATLFPADANDPLPNWPHRISPGRLESFVRQSQSALLRHKRGELVRCGMDFAVSGTAGEPVLIVSLFDISERTRLEQELDFLKRQLATLNRMEVAQFLAGKLLHDFNNILAAIAGHVGLARDAGSRGEADAALDTVLDAARRGSELIQRLRGVPVDCHCRASVKWQHIAQEALSLLRGAVPKQIRMEWSLADETLPVACTESEAHQVVMNLGMNAAASMAPQGGLLNVTLRQVDVDACRVAPHSNAKGGSYACLTVKDAGCGMTPETVARAFEPFFSTKPGKASSGLGLCVVKEIVTRHGGFIEVESTVEVGTEIRAYLPTVT